MIALFQAATKLRKQDSLGVPALERDREPSDGSGVRVGLTELENGRYMIDDHRWTLIFFFFCF